MKKKIDLSVIVLSYNTRELLRYCLKAIKKAKKTGLSWEVFVVDNASVDNSPQMVAKEFTWVKLIKSKKNLGYSGGNNLGLKKAAGRYVLFLNSDTEIFPEALKEVVNFMDKKPKVGALTPKTILFSGKMDPDCHRGFPTPWASITYFLGLEKIFPKSRFFGQYHQFYKDLNKNHEIDAGFGTFMLVRKKVLKQVGNWDESYFFYGEDLDFFYRIKKAGWKVIFFAKPLLKHYKGASSGLRKESGKISPATKETRVKTAKASIRAMEIFYKKFYQDKYPLLITQLILLAIKVKGILRVLFHQLKQ